jgi:UDP-glucose 4-epimerase
MPEYLTMRNSKILITGGAGFVGSNLCYYLLNKIQPDKIYIVDNLLSSEKFNVPLDSKVQFIFGSIANDKVLDLLPKDLEFIFHLSCYHGNQSSIANPIADHENNIFTSLKLFEYAKNFFNLKKIVYAAAGCAVAEKTYGDARPTTEDEPVSLFHDSPYSISKLVGEMYGNYYYKNFNLPFVKARFQNVYGPREILGAGRWRGTKHTVWRNVIPTFIWKSLNNEPLLLDNNGKSTRDFIFIDDIIKGLIACAEKGKNGEAYNLASGTETSINYLAKIINNLIGNNAPVTLCSARDWDRSGRRYGCTKKSKNQLDFRAAVNLDEGLRKTILWTKENNELIRKNIAKHIEFIK